MKIGVLILINILFAIIIGILGNELMLFLEYLFLLCIGNFIIRYFFNDSFSKECLKVFNFIFFIFSIFLAVTHFSLIKNPYIDYFFHNDQIVFYECATDVGKLYWKDIVDGSLLNPLYGNFPLISLIYGTLDKIAIFFGVDDIYLFLKMIIVLMSSLIPSVMCATLYEVGYTKSCVKDVILFSLLSFLFVTSNVLTRDIFVALNYTIIAYLFLKPECRFRYLKMVLLVIITFGFRPENGAFAILFIVSRLIVVEMKNFNFFKLIIVVFSLTFFSVMAYLVIENFHLLDKNINQNQYIDDELKEGSMFALLKNLPFPINFIAVFIYVQLMPFPLSIFIEWEYSGWYTVSSLLTPFYWIYVWLVVFFSMYKQKIKLSLLNGIFYVSLFYIIIVDFLEPSVRRGFAAYSIVFIYYMLNKGEISKYFKKNIFVLTFMMVVILNFVAYAILYSKN